MPAEKPTEAPSEEASGEPTGWFVYVLTAAGGERTYVGVTSDLDRRLAQHNGDLPGGAKATRAGRPWTLAGSLGPFTSRGQVQKLEAVLKRSRGRARLRVLAELAAAREAASA